MQLEMHAFSPYLSSNQRYLYKLGLQVRISGFDGNKGRNQLPEAYVSLVLFCSF